MSDSFICGICRTEHESPHSANTCLVSCWHNVKTQDPIRPVRRIGRYEFACVYCLRSYQTPVLARQCAFECVAELQITSFSGEDLSDKRPRRTWTKPARPAAVLPFARVNSLESEEESKEDEKTESVPEAKGAPTDAPSESAKKAAASAVSAESDDSASKEPRDHTKKFTRAGAKYVCEICKEKYFSKEEVIRCFDGHKGGDLGKQASTGL